MLKYEKIITSKKTSMDFNKDDKICQKCEDREVCILHTGHGCLQDVKKMKKANSLKQNSESGNNIKENNDMI